MTDRRDGVAPVPVPRNSQPDRVAPGCKCLGTLSDTILAAIATMRPWERNLPIHPIPCGCFERTDLRRREQESDPGSSTNARPFAERAYRMSLAVVHELIQPSVRGSTCVAMLRGAP